MSKLIYFYGTMGSGKSTVALQMNYNFKQGNKNGILITTQDRSGTSKVTSRLGFEHEAITVTNETDLWYLLEELITNNPVDYIICDESQFLTPKQINDIGMIVDFYEVNVYCFGLTTDFKGHLFPASKRLFEIADYKQEVEVKTLCWCGRKAIMNTRVCDGYQVLDGDIIQVGDVGEYGYEPLCRKHHGAGLTKKVELERVERRK